MEMNNLEIKEFLGNIDYTDKVTIEKRLEELDKPEFKYEKNKLVYINETTDNFESAKAVWSAYMNNIKPFEKILGKDVYDFTKDEIEQLVLGAATASRSTKSNILFFIVPYCLWALEKRYIVINPCESIDADEVTRVGGSELKAKVFNLDEFQEAIRKIRLKGGLHNEKYKAGFIAIVLARYGICGKKLSYQLNLKWDNIDYKNKKVYIVDPETGELITTLPVDDFFLNMIEVFKTWYDEDIYTDKNEKDYVINKSFMVGDANNNLYRCVEIFYRKSGMEKQLSFNDLVKSRKIDALKVINEEKILIPKDFKVINDLFSPGSSVSAYITLKKDYIEMFGEDKVKSYKVRDTENYENAVEILFEKMV